MTGGETEGGSTAPGEGFRWALRVAVVPWLVARVAVGVALVVGRELVARGQVAPGLATRVHQGLLGWDAGWYESIARGGYAGAGHGSLRFFPLVPALTAGLHLLPGVGVGAALLVVSNLSALAGLAVLAALVRSETGDVALAGRAAWLAALAPVAFVLAMGYAEATLLVLAAATFLAVRRGRWWWGALFGLLAGLTRPLGVLLLVPVAVEAVRAWRAEEGPTGPRRLVPALATLAPAAGCGSYLGWVGWRYHDVLAPLRIQVEGGHRGTLTDPLQTLAHDARLLAEGQHLSEALHLPWVLLALALTAVCFRRWPASYGALALATVAVALTAANLDGFERYALSAFPLVLAGASVTSGPTVERTVLVVSGVGLVGYALLAFTGIYVP